jgi:hypothetical protein
MLYLIRHQEPFNINFSSIVLIPDGDPLESESLNQQQLSHIHKNIINFNDHFSIFNEFKGKIYGDWDGNLDWSEFFAVETFDGFFFSWCWNQSLNNITFLVDSVVTIKIERKNYEIVGFLSVDIYNNLLRRWKKTMKMDIIGNQPQSSVIHYQWGLDQFSCRFSTMKTVNGMKTSVRILHNQFIYLEAMGLNSDVHQQILKLIEESTTFFIGGPMGSGKTSLAYGICNQWIKNGYHVVSWENPPEYNVKNFDQLDYDHGSVEINHLMRHHLGGIFLGEILEESMVQVALSLMASGHRVLTTLHIGSMEDLKYRWASSGKFYKGYGLFPKIINGKILVEIYNIKGELMGKSFEDQE